jgi:hypothetical protein
MTSLRDAFAGMKEAKEDLPAPPAASQARPSKKTQAKAAPIKTAGKSSNPDYSSLKIYVRKETRRKAARKWEDEGGGDLSDLIEHLLSQYTGS